MRSIAQKMGVLKFIIIVYIAKIKAYDHIAPSGHGDMGRQMARGRVHGKIFSRKAYIRI